MKLNPIKIIGGWVLIMIMVDIIVIPILFYKTVGGEQKPLTFLMESITITAYGIFFLSIATGIIYYKRLKQFWILNSIFIFLSGLYIVHEIKGHKISYSYNEHTELIDGFEIRIKKKYYSLNPEKIRSISYWKNEKKDSLWTTYAKDGNIIKQEKYRADTLIETIK